MHQGDASTLAAGGWAFRIDANGGFRAIAGANILAAKLERVPEHEASTGVGLCYGVDSAGAHYLRDARESDRFWRAKVGLTREDMWQRIAAEEEVYSVTDPSELM